MNRKKKKRDISTLVRVMSDYARQGPGGQLDPHFQSLPFCVLCQLGAECLGACCQGMNKPKAKKLSTGSPQVAEVPPGLKIVNRLANAPNRTPRRNARLRRMVESFAPDSDIYRLNSILPSSPAKSSSKKDKVPSKSDQAKVNPVKNVSTFNAKQQRRDFK